MNIAPIRNDEDHLAALRRIEMLWGSEVGTPEGDELDVLVDLVEHYEDRHYPIDQMEPIEFLQAYMEMFGYTQADLGRVLGSAPRASEILRKRRALTVEMIYKLHEVWSVPANCLIRPYHLAA